MKIFVDMDNTLNDFLDTFIARVPNNLKINETNKVFYELKEYVNLPTDKERLHYCDSEYEDPNFWLGMNPLPSSKITLEKMKSLGHSLIIATALPKNKSKNCIDVIKDSKIKWLEKYYPSIFEDVIFTREKYLLQGDILIDDFIKSAYSSDGTRFKGSWWMPLNRFNEENKDKADFVFTNWDQILKVII